MIGYNTFNYFSGGKCPEKSEELKEFAAKYPNLTYREGYGTDSCKIDDDSKIKHSEITNWRGKQQFQTREFQAVPDLSKGIFMPGVESKLVEGQVSTHIVNNCEQLQERNYNRFVPFLDCIKEYVVDGYKPENENVSRSGINTREFTRAKMLKNRDC